MNTNQQRTNDSDELKHLRAVAILQERARLARELHDTIGQVLGYVRLQAHTTQQLISRGQISEANGLLDRLIEVAESAQAEVRDQILSLSVQLPLNSQASGLVNTLRTYIDAVASRSRTVITFIAEPELLDVVIAPDTGAQVIRIVQEAITNANKHSAAQHVWIALTFGDKTLHGVIEDDGQGFSPDDIPQSSSPKFGLRIMSDRAQETGGQLQVLSVLGQGTKVIFDIPCKTQGTQPGESVDGKHPEDGTTLLETKVVPV
jgi:signal transduction histidine kinase